MKKEHADAVNLSMSDIMNHCGHCNTPLPDIIDIYCIKCNALLSALQHKEDYCQLLLGHMPLSFDLDIDTLDKRYFFYQQKTHPDFHLRDKDLAIIHTQFLNEAYHLLKNPLLRAKFLLAQQNIFVGGEKDTVALSPAALMDILEKQELLEDATTLHALALLETQEKEKKEGLLRAISSYFKEENWQLMAEHTLLLRYTTKYIKDIIHKNRTLSH